MLRGANMSVNDLISFCQDTVTGMAYLASFKIIQ
jgi:hypothetical protein